MRPQHQERLIVGGLFALWLAHLLVYVWLVPPWQHYDEPTHFEYAALIRELGRLPTLEEHIPELRRAIAVSMVEGGFFRNPNLPLSAPDLNAPDLSLGINERGHPPLYYVLVALGTAPFRHQPIETQLYAARCVSVALAALLFLAAYAVLRLLTGDNWALRSAVLTALALQPAFVDNLASVNSDALANPVAVLLLLVGVAVVRRPSWRLVLLSALVLVLAWNVKRTLLAYSLVIPLAWLLAAPWPIRRWLLGAAGALALAGAAWVFLQPWALADWRDSGTAGRVLEGYAGRYAFVLRSSAEQPATLTQEIYRYRLLDEGGQHVTLRAWMRADRSATVPAPMLRIDGREIRQTVELDTSWRTVTVTAELPVDAKRVVVELSGAPGATVFLDGLSLTAGDDVPPTEGDPDGSYEAGVLGPQAPRNMVRNAGAERQVPQLPGPLQRLASRMFDQSSLDQALSSLFNLRWIAAVYPRQLWLLFVGSWGIFGWGQYAVPPGWFTPLALLVLASIAGALLLLGWGRERPNGAGWRGRAWWLCALAVVIGWGTALLRVHHQPFPGTMFWSFGRYTFVAMLPSLLFFVAGFRALLPASLRAQGSAGQIAFLVVFALIAVSVFLPMG